MNTFYLTAHLKIRSASVVDHDKVKKGMLHTSNSVVYSRIAISTAKGGSVVGAEQAEDKCHSILII